MHVLRFGDYSLEGEEFSQFARPCTMQTSATTCVCPHGTELATAVQWEAAIAAS